MNKPTTYPLYDYHECIQFIEQKYGFDERDFYSHWPLYNKLCVTAKDQTVEKFGCDSWWSKSPKDYTPEEAACSEFYNKVLKEGKAALPPSLDFWGNWILDTKDISNGCFFSLDEEWDDLDDHPEEFKSIHRWLMEEFGSGEPGARTIEFKVSW